MSFHHRNIRCLATEMYKVKNNLCSPFLQELFSYNEKTYKILRPNVRTVKMGDGSIRSFGPIVWNTMLPNKIKESPNLNIFRDRIGSWVPEGCPCRLCKNHNNNCLCYLCKDD